MGILQAGGAVLLHRDGTAGGNMAGLPGVQRVMDRVVQVVDVQFQGHGRTGRDSGQCGAEPRQ